MKSSSIFQGSAVALLTPMKEDGSLDYEEMGRIIEEQIACGTDAIVVCGTTGETATMTFAEHGETIEACVNFVKKRVPVIAGTGSNSTAMAVKLSKKAQKAGADGILVVTPYYNKATKDGLKQHYQKVATAVDLPLILYNVPGRTGVNMMPETVADLVKEVDTIVAIKEASGNISQVAKLLQLCQGDLDVYAGNDDLIVPITALGGKGVISVAAHIIPKEIHDMVWYVWQGKTKEAAALQLQYFPLIEALFCQVNPIPVKAAMCMRGYQTPTLRLPLTPLPQKEKAHLYQIMRQVGIKM